MYVLIALGVITLAGITYMAVSRKSSFFVRIASLGALSLMVITVVICLLFAFGVIGTSASAVPVLPDAASSSAPAEKGNAFSLIIFIVILVALFLVIVFLSMREQKRSASSKNNADDYGKSLANW